MFLCLTPEEIRYFFHDREEGQAEVVDIDDNNILSYSCPSP
ncbi:hypothetical protein [Candidatus Enterovibrio escicola]|nr:hypothetical protein [Candidatus Enterovibrio escacola]